MDTSASLQWAVGHREPQGRPPLFLHLPSLTHTHTHTHTVATWVKYINMLLHPKVTVTLISASTKHNTAGQGHTRVVQGESQEIILG